MAEDTAKAGAPWHLWIVGIASLLWNSIGGFDYTMTKTRNAGYLANFTPEQIAWMDGFPIWANLGWALGVWGALAGSILLLMKKAWAYQAFAVSLIGLLVSTIYQFGMSDMPESLNTSGGKAFTAFIWAVAIGLYLYARQMRANGVLR